MKMNDLVTQKFTFMTKSRTTGSLCRALWEFVQRINRIERNNSSVFCFVLLCFLCFFLFFKKNLFVSSPTTCLLCEDHSMAYLPSNRKRKKKCGKWKNLK